MSLRNQIIKLAKEKPELRKHLLPLLKEAEDAYQKEDRARAVISKHLKQAYKELGMTLNEFNYYAKMNINEFRGR